MLRTCLILTAALAAGAVPSFAAAAETSATIRVALRVVPVCATHKVTDAAGQPGSQTTCTAGAAHRADHAAAQQTVANDGAGKVVTVTF